MNNEEAIEIFSKVKELPCGWCYEGGDEFKKALDFAIKALEERPQGEWIDHSEDGYLECPICGHLTTSEDNIDELHYCWNCGAYMQKGGAE